MKKTTMSGLVIIIGIRGEIFFAQIDVTVELIKIYPNSEHK